MISPPNKKWMSGKDVPWDSDQFDSGCFAVFFEGMKFYPHIKLGVCDKPFFKDPVMNHSVFHGIVMVSGFVAVAQMWFPLEPLRKDHLAFDK